jgi:hypothetical protein
MEIIKCVPKYKPLELSIRVRWIELLPQVYYLPILNHIVLTWGNSRNNKNAKVKWQFTTEDARIKLTRLYPTFES